MKVSIITTCYNRESTIGSSVRSVMAQTYPDIEHIVIDGASKDNTLKEIERCGSTRIAKLVSEKDSGCYQALNKGVRASSGDIVGWLHSDDVFYDDDVISDVVKEFERTGCDFLYADGLFVSPDNPKWIIRDWVSGTYSDAKIRNGWLPLHTTVFVRRELFERYAYYSEEYMISSDTFWLLKCMYKTGVNIHYMHRYVVRMAYGGLSTNWSRTFHRWREDLGIYYRMGLSPRKALIKKVLRKFPQFVKAPFADAGQTD